MVTLKRCADTNLSSKSTFKKNKEWDDDVKTDEEVKQLSEDGLSIVCSPCSNAKNTKNSGVISMRHQFASGNWRNHKKCAQHCAAVLNLVAESKNERLKGKQQAGLASFSFITKAAPQLVLPASLAASSVLPASLAASSITSSVASAQLARTERYILVTFI
jgi:hypothetical protein